MDESDELKQKLYQCELKCRSLNDALANSEIGVWHYFINEDKWICSEGLFKILNICVKCSPFVIDDFKSFFTNKSADDFNRLFDELLITCSAFVVELEGNAQLLPGKYFKLSANFSEGPENQWSIITGIIQDITEYKTLLLNTTENERKFRFITDYSDDVIWIMDKYLHTTYMSPAVFKQLGYTAAEYLGLELEDRLPSESVATVRETIKQILNRYERKEIYSSECTGTLELVHKHKDGRLIWGDIKYTLIFDDNNNFSGIQGITRNMQDRKEAQEELSNAKLRSEESDRLKGAFLANMSHEIRTPLNGILGFSQLLESTSVPLSKRNDYIRMIRSNGNQLLNIINDIIDISKIEANQLNIKESAFDLSLLLNDLKILFDSEIAARKLEIELEVIEDFNLKHSCILLDELRLKQILSNLLSNALKFTQKGSIKFGCNLIDNNLSFYVRDTGIGMTKIQQEYVFQRFRQADDSTTREYGGTGLGLTISKSLVELMSGKIWIESEMGKGSTFHFTLPYKLGIQNVNLSSNLFSENVSINLLGEIVLIADEDQNELISLEKIFDQSDAQVILARTNIEIIEICKTEKLINWVIISDQIPGDDILNIIKELQINQKDSKVVLLTTFNSNIRNIRHMELIVYSKSLSTSLTLFHL